MKIQAITDNEIEEIADWFVDQPWTLPPVKDGMSKWGFVIGDEASKIACMYVYLTETGYAYLDWIALNPERDFEEHKKACLELVKNIEEILKSAITEPKVSCLVLYTKINWLATALKEIEWRTQKNFIQCTRFIKHEV